MKKAFITGVNGQNRFYHWLVWGIAATLTIAAPLFNAWFGFPFPAPSEGVHSAIGGVIPYSDAEGYLSGAHHFNASGFLDTWNMRRPLNALFFSFRLKVANGNFWYAMAIQAGLCMIALTLYLRTLRQDIGLLATSISLVFCYYYLQVYVHTTLSETLGLTLGLLSFVLVWNGYIQKDRFVFNAGMASLAVALCARAGPNFIIPALFLLVYLDPFTKSRFKDLTFSILSFVVPFLMMNKLSTFFGEPTGSGMAFSNFGATLYGLVSGGKSWTYAYQDPHIQSLITGKSEAQEAKILYRESWNVFKNNPLSLINGMRSYLGGFLIWFVRQLSFGEGIVRALSTIVAIIFLIFLGVRVFIKRHLFNREFLFLILVFTGIAASAMVVFKDGGMLTFAVAIPFMAALFGLSFASQANLKERKTPENILAICTVLFIVLSSILSSFVPFGMKAPDISALKKRKVPGQEIFLTYNPKKQPHLLIDAASGFHFRAISPSTIRKAWIVYSWSDSSIAQDLRNTANQFKNNNLVLLHIYDYISQSNRWVLSENHILDLESEWVEIQASFFSPDFKRIYVANSFMGIP